MLAGDSPRWPSAPGRLKVEGEPRLRSGGSNGVFDYPIQSLFEDEVIVDSFSADGRGYAAAAFRLAGRRPGGRVPRPYVLADRIELQRDVYYGVYTASVVGLFVGWSRSTGQSLGEMCARRWKVAVAFGLVAAGTMAFLATRQDVSGPHPGGLTFVGSVAWRGVVYGAADGLLLSAFPILLVFAALKNTKLRKRARGAVAVGAVAIVASMAMTAVYHAGYSDFRSSKLSKPLTGDLVWSIPTLATLNPIGAPIAHIGLHVSAVFHNYASNLFLHH